MGASHGQHMAALQHMFAQPLGAAGVGQALVEDGFHQRELGAAIGQVCAADHIANDEHVGLEGQLLRAIAFDQFNAQGLQLVAHGRVDPRVTTGDLMTRFACQRGDTAHEGAANAQDMNMHGQGF